MKRLILCVTVVLLGVGHAESAITPSTTDLFDVSTGVQVTAHSSLITWIPNNEIEYLLGGGENTPDANNWMIHFADDQGLGYVHFVDFQTPEAVTIGSFALFAEHDALPGRDYRARGFSTFRLYGEGELVYSLTTGNPYSTTEAPPGSIIEVSENGDRYLNFEANLPEAVTAQHWRAEFIQAGDLYRGHANGPRVLELDGFGVEPVPEPTTLVMWSVFAAFGIFCGWRRRRGQ